jgi:N-acyl-D-amino-acid deacylase
VADYDIIIRSGTIVDGTRTLRYVGDLAIKDDKTADRILDATGRIVAPGFIDLHTH